MPQGNRSVMLVPSQDLQQQSLYILSAVAHSKIQKCKDNKEKQEKM